MNVLEKILEEIEEATFQEDAPVYIGDMKADGYVRESIVKAIIRSHMSEVDNDGWIPCSKQLPEDGTYSYAIPQSTSASGATFEEEGNYNFRLYRGTHSSKRYKDVGQDMCYEDIQGLYNIRPVWAKYKEGYLGEKDERCGVEHPMFIAEDVEKYAPLAVDHNKEGQAENWNYRIMIPYMFQMLKEQKKEIEQLKNDIEEYRKGGE